jgi:hypothetical protein
MFLGAIPAIYIGFQVGLIAADVGSRRELASIFGRALICAAPAAVLAVFAPRSWLIPSITYACGFCYGYLIPDLIRAAALIFPAIAMAALRGERLGSSSEPTHPELIWLLIITFWMASFISFLCRHYSHANEGA